MSSGSARTRPRRPSARVRKPVVASRNNVAPSHGPKVVSTKRKALSPNNASRTPVNAGEPRREGDAEYGTSQKHGGGECGRATEASDAPKPSKQRRRPGLHPPVCLARGVQARGLRAVDRIPTPDEHVRPQPRPRGVK